MDTHCWQEIGNQLVRDDETGVECKMITRRMKLPFGWRILVTYFWKEDGRTQIRTDNFNVADAVKKWTPQQWAEAEAVFAVPELDEAKAKEA